MFEVWKTRRIARDEVEAIVEARVRDLEARFRALEGDVLQSYEKTLSLHRKIVKRMKDASEALEAPTTVDRQYRKAQIRLRRLGRHGGNGGVPAT